MTAVGLYPRPMKRNVKELIGAQQLNTWGTKFGHGAHWPWGALTLARNDFMAFPIVDIIAASTLLHIAEPRAR